MHHTRSSKLLGALVTLLLLTFASAGVQAQNLNTLRLEIRKAEVVEGQFHVFFSFLDPSQVAIKELTIEQLQLLSGEDQVEVKLNEPALQLFADSNFSVAVMFVVANYRAFNEQSTKSRAAIIEFIGKMRSQDVVGVVHYGDTYHYTGATTESNLAVEAVTAIKDSDDGIPRFFAALSQALRKFEQDIKDVDLRYLIIVSDGYGPWVGDKTSQSRDRKVEQTAKRLEELQITPLIIGYSPTADPEDQGVTMLRQLAARSKGTYRGPNDREEIFTALEQAYQEVYNSHVLTFKTDIFEKNKTHKIRLLAKTKSLEAKSPPAEIFVPEPPGPDLLWFIVGGSACLLLGLIVAIIVGFVVWQRKKKANAPEPYYEEPVPVGGPMPMAPAAGMVAPAMAQAAAAQYDDSPPPNYFAKLKAVSGSLHGRTFYVVEEQTTIGRVDGNNVMLPDGSVSSKHAGIRVRDGNRFELHDFGSTNGVFINGKRIKKQFLKDGDKVRIGDIEFVFSVDT